VELTFDSGRRRSSRSLPQGTPLSIDALLAALDEVAGDALEERPRPAADVPPPSSPTARRTLGARAAVRVEAWSSSGFATGPRVDALVGLGRVDV
jgi:hypothetical protein